MEQSLEANVGKKLEITVNGKSYARLPIRTHVITADDDFVEIVQRYALPYAQKGDILFASEKMLAITQNRSIPLKDIHPSKLAYWAVKFVYKNPNGLGIATPWTMEMVIQESGLVRFVFSCAAAIVTKPLGMRGMFYRLIGTRAKAIDGPIPHAMPPYNERVTLTPLNTDEAAKEIKDKFGYDMVIIDANDLGVESLGRSSAELSDEWASAVFKDNPLGQSREQTPLCLVRVVK